MMQYIHIYCVAHTWPYKHTVPGYPVQVLNTQNEVPVQGIHECRRYYVQVEGISHNYSQLPGYTWYLF